MLLNQYETAILVKNGTQKFRSIRKNFAKFTGRLFYVRYSSNNYIVGFGIIYDGNTPYPIPTADDITKFKEEREADFQKQDEDARIKKQLGELQYKNIKNVKRPKNKKKEMSDSQEIRPDSVTNTSNPENNVNNDININVNNTSENNEKNNQQPKKFKNKPQERQHGVVTTFVEDYWLKRDIKTVDMSSTVDVVYKDHKYLVFEDLWLRGFYVNGGSKFGGDFLAYPGKFPFMVAALNRFFLRQFNFAKESIIFDPRENFRYGCDLTVLFR